MSGLEVLSSGTSATPGLQLNHQINPFRDHLVEFEGLRLGISRAWLYRTLRSTSAALRQMAQQRNGDTCVIAGNGPSLNDVNWDCLDNLDVFASNYAFLHPELGKRTRYLSVINPYVAAQEQERFTRYESTLLMPCYLAYWIPLSKNHLAINTHFGYTPATHIGQPVAARSTVSYFNMQMALCLGYSRVLLVGFDHTYLQPEDAVEGDLIAQKDEDPNHFSDEYFANKHWQAADTRKMDVVYALADSAFGQAGGQIINCSGDRSNLTVFPRGLLAMEIKEVPKPEVGDAPDRWSIVLARRISKLEQSSFKRDWLTASAATFVFLCLIYLMEAVLDSALATYLVMFVTGTSLLALFSAFTRVRSEVEIERHTDALLASQNTTEKTGADQR